MAEDVIARPMVAPWLQEQLDAIGRKAESWPEWRKRKIEAEIARTPPRTRKEKPQESAS